MMGDDDALFTVPAVLQIKWNAICTVRLCNQCKISVKLIGDLLADGSHRVRVPGNGTCTVLYPWVVAVTSAKLMSFEVTLALSLWRSDH